MVIENINNYVINFIEMNKDSNLVELWKSKKNQQNLLKTLKKNNITIKDPLKPKRGKSGFLFFCDEYRSKVKSEFPDMKVKEIVSTLGIRWKELKKENSEEILKFEKLSLDDRNRYKKEMHDYIPVLNRKYKYVKSVKKVKSKKRSKRTQNEIMFDNFIKSKKNKIKKLHPEFELKDIIDYLKNKWNEMSDEKKKKYVNKKL